MPLGPTCGSGTCVTVCSEVSRQFMKLLRQLVGFNRNPFAVSWLMLRAMAQAAQTLCRRLSYMSRFAWLCAFQEAPEIMDCVLAGRTLNSDRATLLLRIFYTHAIEICTCLAAPQCCAMCNQRRKGPSASVQVSLLESYTQSGCADSTHRVVVPKDLIEIVSGNTAGKGATVKPQSSF